MVMMSQNELQNQNPQASAGVRAEIRQVCYMSSLHSLEKEASHLNGRQGKSKWNMELPHESMPIINSAAQKAVGYRMNSNL